MLGSWSIIDCNGWVGEEVGLMLLWCECGLDLRCTGGEKRSKAKQSKGNNGDKSDTFGEVDLDGAIRLGVRDGVWAPARRLLTLLSPGR